MLRCGVRSAQRADPTPAGAHSISRVRAFAGFGDETLDPRPEKRGQRYRAKLEHRIVESADVEFETRSLPNLLVATLATLPSMSLIPSAPFAPSVFSAFSRARTIASPPGAPKRSKPSAAPLMHHKRLTIDSSAGVAPALQFNGWNHAS